MLRLFVPDERKPGKNADFALYFLVVMDCFDTLQHLFMKHIGTLYYSVPLNTHK